MTTPDPNRRTPIVAGNWKMNYGPSDAHDFVTSILDGLVGIVGVERVLCPPTISLDAVHALISGTEIELGAQNMYFEPQGAYTGETAPTMLHGLCRYVILGHSERRGYFGETDELVNKKVQAAFAYGLRPIVCVGERLEERDAGQTERVLTHEIHGSLANLEALSPEQRRTLVVAYEPIWAIGTGRAASPQDAADAAGLIRALLGQMYGDETARAVRIQYGGSVTAANVAQFAALDDIDGSLVGGASLKDEFVEIVRLTARAKGLGA